MTRTTHLDLANSLALLGPTALLGGALAFQHFGGLPPCEMCYWQRWPHLAAIACALAALALHRTAARVPLLAVAGLAVLVSAGIGVFHAGVEQHWWQGLTRCSTTAASSGDQFLKDMLATPLVRCDAIPWSLFGVSLAGWNALLSTLVGGSVLWLTTRT